MIDLDPTMPHRLAQYDPAAQQHPQWPARLGWAAAFLAAVAAVVIPTAPYVVWLALEAAART